MREIEFVSVEKTVMFAALYSRGESEGCFKSKSIWEPKHMGAVAGTADSLADAYLPLG